MVQCFNAEDRRAYIHDLEKVKFGVSIHDAFTHDIPATLLVLLLKINKQGPLKKDIWRAPGNQSHVRKLINIMQHGRLVNIDNFSVYTAASVIKKFLCKIPDGIFGQDHEQHLFSVLKMDDVDKQRSAFCRIVSLLPVASQHLLVLLIGTFSCIVEGAEAHGTRMTADALGVSVAPSIFHSCIHERNRAKMEDIVRFREASRSVAFMIRNFGRTNLFPRENYEFYARITGRTLRVDENWQFSFHYPSTCDFSSMSARGTATSSRRGGCLVPHEAVVASGALSPCHRCRVAKRDPRRPLHDDSRAAWVFAQNEAECGMETRPPQSRSLSGPARVGSCDDLLQLNAALLPLFGAGDAEDAVGEAYRYATAVVTLQGRGLDERFDSAAAAFKANSCDF